MAKQNLSIYYDGECPVCSHYVRHARLSNTHDVLLVNLRNHPRKVASFNDQGLNVDEGMIIRLDDAIYHGCEAMHVLALLSTPSGFFNRINRTIFSRRRLANLLYPALMRGRNLLLIILRRKKINVD